MRRRVYCGLEERQKQVPQQLSKVLQQVLLPVDITADKGEKRDLASILIHLHVVIFPTLHANFWKT